MTLSRGEICYDPFKNMALISKTAADVNVFVYFS